MDDLPLSLLASMGAMLALGAVVVFYAHGLSPLRAAWSFARHAPGVIRDLWRIARHKPERKH